MSAVNSKALGALAKASLIFMLILHSNGGIKFGPAVDNAGDSWFEVYAAVGILSAEFIMPIGAVDDGAAFGEI